MKKLFAILLTLSMILSLCACSGDTTPADTTPDTTIGGNDSLQVPSNDSTESSEPMPEEMDVLRAYFDILTSLNVESNISTPFYAETPKGEEPHYINIDRPAQRFYERLKELDKSVIEKWKDAPYTAAEAWNNVTIDRDYDAVMSRFTMVDNVLLERRYTYTDRLGNVDGPKVYALFSYDKDGREMIRYAIEGKEDSQTKYIFDFYDNPLSNPLNYLGLGSYDREYTTDADGMITQIKYIRGYNGEVAYLVTPSYDDAGNRTGDVAISGDSEKTIRYSYNDNSQLIRVDYTKYYHEDLICSTEYTYSGNKIVKISTTIQGEPYAEVAEFTYDNSGKLATATYSYMGEQAVYTFTHNEQGQILTADITLSGEEGVYPTGVMENIYGTCYIYTPAE